jgi:putative NADH-flavin reductase
MGIRSSLIVKATFLSVLLCLAGCAAEGSKFGASLADVGEGAPVLATEAPASLRVLVIGGTQGTGLEVVRLGLARGYQMTAVARHPEKMPLADERLSNVAGDITDAKRMAELVAGQDVVVSAIGIGPSREEVSLFSEGMKNVLAAMPDSNKAQLITVSGIGAGDSRGHGGFIYDNIVYPLLTKQIYLDKDRQEALIKASDVRWTIVRPGLLTDDSAATNYRVLEDMDGVVSGEISRADVAHFIVAAFEQQSHIGKTVFLTN